MKPRPRKPGRSEEPLGSSAALTLGLDIDMTIFDTVRACQLVPGGEGVTDSSWDGLVAACGEAGRLDVLTRACALPHALRVGLFPGAATALQDLVRRGVRLHVMTARSEAVAVEAARLLAAYRLPLHGFSCGVREKVELAKAMGLSALIDDDPAILTSATAAGLPAFALRHPQNADVLDELGVPHAENWSGLHRLLVDWLAVRPNVAA